MRSAILAITVGLVVGFGSLEAAQRQKIDCSGFGTPEQIRLNVRTDPEVDGQLIVRWGLEKVPATAYYVVRVWPEGRGVGRYLDIPMDAGNIQEGSSLNGQETFLVTHLRPGIKETTRFDNAQLDIDVWENRADYEANRRGATLGQCDPGRRPFTASFKEPTPPPDPEKPTEEVCECQILVNEEGRSRAITACTGDPNFGRRSREVVRVTPRRCATS